MKLRGIIPAMVTPLHEDETVHEEHLRRLVDYLIRSGVHGIFVNGSMGMFNHLDDDQQERAIAICVDQVAGRVPLMAGVSDTCTRIVIRKARKAGELGANYVSALPPYYDSYSPAQVTRFYREVARGSGVPVFMYNNPWTMKTSMTVDTLAGLAEEPNIAGVKDSTGNAVHYQELIRRLGGRPAFSLLLGTGKLAGFGLWRGADGLIEGIFNVRPEWAVGLWDAAQAGDWAKV
jgi:4-hydroxy-tetrahydrodipicolinate synthase